MTPACIKVLWEACKAMQHVGSGESLTEAQRARIFELGCELGVIASIEEEGERQRKERLKV